MLIRPTSLHHNITIGLGVSPVNKLITKLLRNFQFSIVKYRKLWYNSFKVNRPNLQCPSLMVRARYGTGVFLKFNIQIHEVLTKPPPTLFCFIYALGDRFYAFVDMRKCAYAKAL